MTKTAAFALLISIVSIFLASNAAHRNQENAAADQAASAFLQARDAAYLPKMVRIGRNAFHKQACGDRRFASGLILDVTYQTTNPGTLPDSARKLAARPDSDTIAVRFGVGVCLAANDSTGQPEYTVLIATYESRWSSFWHIFAD